MSGDSAAARRSAVRVDAAAAVLGLQPQAAPQFSSKGACRQVGLLMGQCVSSFCCSVSGSPGTNEDR